MVDIDNIQKYQEMCAQVHDINPTTLRNPLEYHFEFAEADLLHLVKAHGMYTVGDLLLWQLVYGPHPNFLDTISKGRVQLSNVMKRLKQQ